MQIAFIINHAQAHLGMQGHLHTDADPKRSNVRRCMLEHARACTRRGNDEEGSHTKRLGLIISCSFFLGQTPALVLPSPFS